MTWVLANVPLVTTYLLAHLAQVVPAVCAALVLSLPVALAAQRAGVLRGLIVSGSSLLYAIPSLALFVVLPLILGTGIRDATNVVVALTLYGMALLVPAAVDALDAVDHRVLDAAAAMGMGRLRTMVTVELPLAGPAILAALRVVTVSTVSLTTVGAVLGVRSLGWLFTDGFQRGITAEVLTGVLATVALALALDAVVLALGRLALPWTRRPAGDPGDTGLTADTGDAGGAAHGMVDKAVDGAAGGGRGHR
ncbi:MAG: ABC transporter permease subunit [Actinomyces sp.]|uniref:ABC transporter permease n=1 Tax=Actinomyces sp. TaxID=29317 RepID=UPI0026DCE4B6|nr:ABC transporter permease subunit [Actinomyces sp.]MDO4244067.1 ABC transporter permease subunit [Actinomyces sp.]